MQQIFITGLAWSSGGVSAPHLGAAPGPPPPWLTGRPRELYLGRSSSCHSSFTSTFSIRSVASVVPMGAGKRRWSEAGMDSEGESWMEVLLDNHPNNNNLPRMCSTHIHLQRALASIVLLNPCQAPWAAPIYRWENRSIGSDEHPPMGVWSLNTGERLRRLHLQTPLPLKL